MPLLLAVLYDVRDFESFLPDPGLLFAVSLGTLASVLGIRYSKPFRKQLPFAGLGLLMLLLAYSSYVQPLRWKLENGRRLTAGGAESVQGIARIVPRVKSETIQIENKVLTILPYGPGGGFQMVTSLGSPLHDGDNLKIEWIGNDIVRIERLPEP
jgi:hypothetical protein